MRGVSIRQHQTVRLDILPRVRVIPEPADVLADVASAIAETPVKIDEGDTQTLGN